MKNEEIIEKILAYHPNLPNYEGCDGYKCGNPKEECKGVAVALVPTVDVIKRAAEAGCNLLVTHEPIFYQTPDFDGWKGDFTNKIYEEKMEIIQTTGMTVWRDHDHMHAHKPDSIFSGVIKELEWEKYYIDPESEISVCMYLFEVPDLKIRDIAEHLKKTLGLNGMKYMGDLDHTVKKIALVGHLYPNCFLEDHMDEEGFYHDYAMEIMKVMEEKGVELIIPGEIIEWTVLAYIRDAIDMEKNMACLSMGHFNLEELGMKDFTQKIEKLLRAHNDHDFPKVVYIPTKDGFSYL